MASIQNESKNEAKDAVSVKSLVKIPTEKATEWLPSISRDLRIHRARPCTEIATKEDKIAMKKDTEGTGVPFVSSSSGFPCWASLPR